MNLFAPSSLAVYETGAQCGDSRPRFLFRRSRIDQSVKLLNVNDCIRDHVVHAQDHWRWQNVSPIARGEIGVGLETGRRIVGRPKQPDGCGRDALDRDHGTGRSDEAREHYGFARAAVVGDLE